MFEKLETDYEICSGIFLPNFFIS